MRYLPAVGSEAIFEVSFPVVYWKTSNGISHMTRPTAPFPTYRNHKSSGQAVVTLGGHEHYLGKFDTAASRAEYDRLISEWIAAGRPKTGFLDSQLTVVVLCRDYLRHAKTYYCNGNRGTGELHPIKAMIKLLRTHYGRQRAVDFGPLSLKALREKMIDKGWSRSTINQQVQRIKRMFRWAVSEEKLPPESIQALSSVDGLRAGRSRAREPRKILPIDDAAVDKTLPFLSPIVADMVRLQRLTGTRPEEICNLRPCDVDRSSEIWVYRPSIHKNLHRGLDRSIYFGPKAQAVLSKYLDRDPDSYCFSAAESETDRRDRRHAERRTPINAGNRPGTNCRRDPQRTAGDRYRTDSYRRAIARACKAAKIPTWAPNRLRHAAATEIRRKFGLEASQVVLGHTNADVTQIYAERDQNLALKVMKELG